MLLLGLKQQRRNQYLESGEDAGDSLTKVNSNWLEKAVMVLVSFVIPSLSFGIKRLEKFTRSMQAQGLCWQLASPRAAASNSLSA
jgi:hypothetical protein